jgi:hypothetical protein
VRKRGRERRRRSLGFCFGAAWGFKTEQEQEQQPTEKVLKLKSIPFAYMPTSDFRRKSSLAHSNSRYDFDLWITSYFYFYLEIIDFVDVSFEVLDTFSRL